MFVDKLHVVLLALMKLRMQLLVKKEPKNEEGLKNRNYELC